MTKCAQDAAPMVSRAPAAGPGAAPTIEPAAGPSPVALVSATAPSMPMSFYLPSKPIPTDLTAFVSDIKQAESDDVAQEYTHKLFNFEKNKWYILPEVKGAKSAWELWVTENWLGCDLYRTPIKTHTPFQYIGYLTPQPGVYGGGGVLYRTVANKYYSCYPSDIHGAIEIIPPNIT